jgi:hypothetical protein
MVDRTEMSNVAIIRQHAASAMRMLSDIDVMAQQAGPLTPHDLRGGQSTVRQGQPLSAAVPWQTIAAKSQCTPAPWPRQKNARVYRPDISLLKQIGQQRQQAALLQILRHIPFGPQDDAMSVQRPLPGDFAVIAGQPAAHPHHHLRLRAAQRPAAIVLVALADADALMAGSSVADCGMPCAAIYAGVAHKCAGYPQCGG